MGVFKHWPNRITALRFVGALALFAIFALKCMDEPLDPPVDRHWHVVTFWVFVLTAASDVLDGYLARKGNHVTAFGRISDPFVDKVLVLGAMVFLAVMPWSQPWFPAWIVVVVIAREFLITAIRGYVESLGSHLPADWFGKVKMFAQCFAIGTVLGIRAFGFDQPFWNVVAHSLVWFTLVTSVGSCISYLVKTRRFLLEEATR